MQYLELVAWERYYADISDCCVRGEFGGSVWHAEKDKDVQHKLFSAIRDQIAVDPAKFRVLALRKQPPLESAVENCVHTCT